MRPGVRNIWQQPPSPLHQPSLHPTWPSDPISAVALSAGDVSQPLTQAALTGKKCSHRVPSCSRPRGVCIVIECDSSTLQVNAMERTRGGRGVCRHRGHNWAGGLSRCSWDAGVNFTLPACTIGCCGSLGLGGARTVDPLAVSRGTLCKLALSTCVMCCWSTDGLRGQYRRYHHRSEQPACMVTLAYALPGTTPL